ncbi:hypothetical protein AC578_6299 [Pseudocercospora eumusae]|uniref:Uncharacterized protein n=1 Tax=Pseudocercospora eumusae TaxID=321146 RepID=A0A139H2B5_9PEZI|nr:hypothetical protein AC578_6299 [Pseudocercospora eumusae]
MPISFIYDTHSECIFVSTALGAAAAAAARVYHQRVCLPYLLEPPSPKHLQDFYDTLTDIDLGFSFGMADTIPTELIERTLAYAAELDTQTCYSICLTNKLGLRVARPVLYRSIRIPGHRDDNLIDQRMHQLSLLCRTMLESRSLSRQVTELDVYVDDLDHITFKVPPAPDEAAFERLVSTGMPITPLQAKEIAAWFEHQRYTYRPVDDEDSEDEDYDFETDPVFGPGMYLASIMMACPNLEILAVGGNMAELQPVHELNQALESQDQETETREGPFRNGLGNIKGVLIRNTAENDEVTVEHIMPMLYWPALRKLTMEMLMPCLESPFAGVHPPSNLEQLHISECDVDSIDDLALLLDILPELKILDIKWSDAGNTFGLMEWHELSRRLIGNSVSHGNRLLEELRLYIPHHEKGGKYYLGTDADLMHPNSPRLGSLLEMQHLRKLAVPKIALSDVFDDPAERGKEWRLAEILPNSVEEVEIFCEGADFTEDDKALLEAPGTARLQDITIFNCTRSKWISKARGEGSMHKAGATS